MFGDRFGPRREGGVREGGGMSQVNKGPVELGQDRRVLTIGPSEISPKQRNLHNPQIADSVVESGHEGIVDIVVVFLVPGTDEIEISDDDPRAIDLRREIRQRSDSSRRNSLVRR